jgi:hypothetical protein
MLHKKLYDNIRQKRKKEKKIQIHSKKIGVDDDVSTQNVLSSRILTHVHL